MEYIVGIKVVKQKKENDPFGFKEVTTYIETPFEDKCDALGYITKVILCNMETEEEEYYFKYSHSENKYNRGYISANNNVISKIYLDMIIKEVDNE